MNKKTIVTLVIEQLERDREVIALALKAAHEAATHEESKAENKYDTRGLEAAYLADGQRRRLHQIDTAIVAYRNLPLDHVEAVVRMGALIEVEGDTGKRHLFLGPDAAGFKLGLDHIEILVITPQSPIGKALLGRCIGDEVSVTVAGKAQYYEVIALA